MKYIKNLALTRLYGYHINWWQTALVYIFWKIKMIQLVKQMEQHRRDKR